MPARKYNYRVDTPKSVRRILDHLDKTLEGSPDTDNRLQLICKRMMRSGYGRQRDLGDVLGFKLTVIDIVPILVITALVWMLGFVFSEYRVQAWTVAGFISSVMLFARLEHLYLVRSILPRLGEFHQVEEVVAGNINPLEIYNAVPFPFNTIFLGPKPSSIEESVALVVSNLDWFATRPKHLFRWTWLMMPFAFACFPLVQLEIPGHGVFRDMMMTLYLIIAMFITVYHACSQRRFGFLATAVGWLERRYIIEFHDNT